MSRENVEVVRRGFEVMNSGDLAQIGAFIHPDFEAEIPSGVSAEPDTYRGHDGLRRYFQSFEDAMEEIRFFPERFWEVGEKVVVTVRLTAKGKNTGIPVEQRTTQVWTIREGKAVRNEVYSDVAEALGAAGLSEEASPLPAPSRDHRS